MDDVKFGSSDPRVKAADEQLVILDEWLGELTSLEANNDIHLLTGFLKSIRRAYLHLRAGWQTDSSHVAWACRNLLELSVFAKYVTVSPDNRDRFIQDCSIDNYESADALINLARQVTPPSNQLDQDVAEIMRAVDALKAQTGVANGKYLQARDLAEDLGMTWDKEIFKLCSKLIHPTAQSIMGLDIESNHERDALFVQGIRYFIDAMHDLVPCIEKLISEHP